MDFGNAMDQQVKKNIEEHLPEIRKIFQKTVGAAALEAAKNDKACEILFTQVYKQLPLPVRLVVKKEAFNKYCFKNRDKLICNS